MLSPFSLSYERISHLNMIYWNLLTLSSLLAITSGHDTIDGSKGSTYVRVPIGASRNDLYHHHRHRSLALEKELMLQISWWNWAFCSKLYPVENVNYTTMSGVVPKNTVFLAGYYNYSDYSSSPATCKSKTITRSGTISTGQQTVFFPISNTLTFDAEDNWEKNCTLQNETDANRVADAQRANSSFTDPTLTGQLYLEIDGKNATPFYLYDESKSYLSACDDKNKTLAGISPYYEGDECDNEPFETIGGMDVGALVGWYGIDIRTWVDGETHTYEFGSLYDCITAKYILTAKAPPTTAPTKTPTKLPSKAPTKAPTKTPTKAPITEDKCGLFGIGIFCPFAWLKWFFGLFT